MCPRAPCWTPACELTQPKGCHSKGGEPYFQATHGSNFGKKVATSSSIACLDTEFNAFFMSTLASQS